MTIDLDPKAFEMAHSKSLRENISIEEAISRLILEAIDAKDSSKFVSRASAVFRSRGGVYSSAQVKAALE